MNEQKDTRPKQVSFCYSPHEFDKQVSVFFRNKEHQLLISKV